uniref:Protein Wnt n=1 Tax=Anopheles culicifacies TaxID=139723 RepID=A0A182M5V9_9DIPT
MAYTTETVKNVITVSVVFHQPADVFIPIRPGRAEGSNVLLDPDRVCESKHRKSRRLSGKLADICKNHTSLMREIHRGISLGFRECENQFRHNMWNCSWTIKRSMRRILAKGNLNMKLNEFTQCMFTANVRNVNSVPSLATGKTDPEQESHLGFAKTS